jgi:hypothetical protein
MSETVTLDVTTVEETVSVTTTDGGVVQIAVMAERGEAGTNGTNGGSTSAWQYNAKTNATSGYPGNGYLLWNNATQTSATSILVSHLTDDNTDIELFLSFFVVNQKIFIQDRDDSSKNQVWLISGTPTVTGANTSTAYYTFPVTLVSSAGGAFTNNHSILFGQISVATNAVTSATTSDGTATLSTSTLTTGTLTVSTSGVFNATSYTYGTGAASAMRTALALGTLATQSGTFSGTSSGINTGDQDLSGYATINSLGTAAAFDVAPTANISEDVVTTAVAQTLTNKTLTSPTIDAPTISGSAAFTSTTRPTSAGTGMPSATSLMTRDDVALEPFYNLGSVFRVSATPAFANSGTGSAASQAAGDRWAALSSGTSNSGWGRAQIGRGITTIPSLSGAGINFASKLGVSIVLWLGNSAATNNLNIFRLRFGSDNTPVADGVDAVSYRGFGVEIKARGTSHDWRVYGHNGTSITYSAWSNTGLNANSLQSRISLTVMSNGAGSITASIGINGSRILSTISTTGGPTTAGTSAQSQVECHVANSASGTLPLAAALYDAIFYAQS